MATKARPVSATAAKPKKAAKPEDIIAEIYRQVEARFRIGQAVYESQDDLTKEVIDRIRDRLVIASTGVVQVNGMPLKLEQEYVDKNILFLATEIMSDLALMGIQVANFEFSPAYCAICKKGLTGVPVSKKKRSRRG